MTMKLGQWLRDCAGTLQDEQLLAKLSAGDVIAQEFTFHPACLATFDNRERERLCGKKVKVILRILLLPN